VPAAIAFRDAQDRAEQLEHRDEAEVAMRRSLDARDRTMVNAIARKAHTRGWAEVATMGVDLELLQDVSRLARTPASSALDGRGARPLGRPSSSRRDRLARKRAPGHTSRSDSRARRSCVGRLLV
jgi:hypothetical protein